MLPPIFGVSHADPAANFSWPCIPYHLKGTRAEATPHRDTHNRSMTYCAGVTADFFIHHDSIVEEPCSWLCAHKMHVKVRSVFFEPARRLVALAIRCFDQYGCLLTIL